MGLFSKLLGLVQGPSFKWETIPDSMRPTSEGEVYALGVGGVNYFVMPEGDGTFSIVWWTAGDVCHVEAGPYSLEEAKRYAEREASRAT